MMHKYFKIILDIIVQSSLPLPVISAKIYRWFNNIDPKDNKIIRKIKKMFGQIVRNNCWNNPYGSVNLIVRRNT